jgi:hypothetical protein
MISSDFEVRYAPESGRCADKLALDTIKRREPGSTEIRVTGRVRQFMDGELLVVTRIDDTKDEVEDLVFVRRGRVSVYDTAEEMATSLKSMERSQGISRFLEGRAIAGLLAIVLTAIWIYFVIEAGLDGQVPSVVRYSFGLVVGYYFKGQVLKAS